MQQANLSYCHMPTQEHHAHFSFLKGYVTNSCWVWFFYLKIVSLNLPQGLALLTHLMPVRGIGILAENCFSQSRKSFFPEAPWQTNSFTCQIKMNFNLSFLALFPAPCSLTWKLSLLCIYVPPILKHEHMVAVSDQVHQLEWKTVRL